MLPFQNEILLELMSDNGLTVMARGLGVERVFTGILKVYCDPGNLVLVLGTNPNEEEYFISQLDSDGVHPLPKSITAECSVKDRNSTYMDGGVIFVTSRILVVDFLMKRVPIDLVTGIIVYKAHRVMETCQEAFILRLFRQSNSEGFIKAISGSPLAFTAGFCQVSRVMRTLFVRNLHLWPRFHKVVADSLRENQPKVEEIGVPMTYSMLTIQTAILDLVNSTIQELKRVNPTLDAEEMTVENAISKSWQKTLQQELDPVWHQLSKKTRQLIADLKVLRTLLLELCGMDCVSFYSLMESLRSTEQVLKSGGWMLLDSAETLFMHAKQRVYGESKKEGKVQPEANPKWRVLAEIMKEVTERDEEVKSSVSSNPFISTKVLIITEEERTSLQVREVLSKGVDAMLSRLVKRVLSLDMKISESGEPSRKKAKTVDDDSAITLTQISSKYDTEKEEKESDPFEGHQVLSSPVTLLYSLKGMADPLKSLRLLHDIQPNYIIMYDVDMGFIRQIEVWKSANPQHSLQVYFMMYQDSAEEQAYLTSLRREKSAFEHLIHEKANMVIPEDQEGKLGDNVALRRGPQRSEDAADVELNSRKGGAEESVPRIIVDMREFRSELPSLIHKRGIDIDPVTIQVGDYILSPDICVERKSLSDLIGSLNSGRLYNQAVSMTRCYRRPMLLIEFPHDKPFTLSHGRYYLSSDASSSDFISKLQLLTLHFPDLRLIWSPSPYATAEIFCELKNGRPQPDSKDAQSKSSEENSDLASGKYNPVVQDFLSKLPGVNSKNQALLMNKVKDFGHLLSLSQSALGEILQNSKDAQKLWSALHENLTEFHEVEEDSKKRKWTSRNKRNRK